MAFVALACGLVLALAQPPPSQAVERIDIALTFTDLAPGVPRTETGTYHLARDARLTRLDWIERTGVFESALVSVQVCDSVGLCVAAHDLQAANLAGGPVAVAVTVVLDAAAPGTTGRATGALTFTADEDELAATGADAASALLWAGRSA